MTSRRSASWRLAWRSKFSRHGHAWTPIATSLACVVGLIGWTGAYRLAFGQTPSAPGDATRFTAAPGQETDAIRELINQAKAAIDSGKSTTAILTDPTFLSAHEWPRFRKLIRASAQPSPITIVSANEPGQPLTVTGRVVDDSGQLVKGALMYCYQTNDKGWYSDRAAHIGGNEGDRKHARLFGYLKTDDAGRFELSTICPTGYPQSDLPAHIHVEVERVNDRARNLITEIQFDDDPRLTAVWRKRSQMEGFVIAKVTTDSENRKRVDVELRMR